MSLMTLGFNIALWAVCCCLCITAAGSPEVRTNFVDAVGRVYKVAYGGAVSPRPFERQWFNDKGQVWKVVDADGVAELYQYDAAGDPEYVAVDLDRDDVIDFAGTDRVTKIARSVVNNATMGSNVAREEIYGWHTDGVDNGRLLATFDVSADGRKAWETIWNGGSGITWKRQTTYGAAGSRTVDQIAPDGSMVTEGYANGRLVSETMKNAAGGQIGRVDYGYDAHGRVGTVTDARNGSFTYVYNGNDQVVSASTPAPGPGQSPLTTTLSYSNLGLLNYVIFADGTRQDNEYFLTGDLKKSSGTLAYPAEYTYDPVGRLKDFEVYVSQTPFSGLGSEVAQKK